MLGPRQLPLILLFLFHSPLLPAQVRQAWTLSNQGLYWGRPVVDGRGNLFVLANDTRGDSHFIQYDPRGVVVREFPVEFAMTGFAVDPAGEVYVAGRSRIAKYSGSGDFRWSLTMPEGNWGIQVGPEGVHALGIPATLTTSEVTTARLDREGNPVWVATFRASEVGAQYLILADWKVDGEGAASVVATAVRRVSGEVPSSLLALRYGSDGSLKWRREFTPREEVPYLHALDLAVDREGNLLVLGGYWPLILVKFDPRGDVMWDVSKEVTNPHGLVVDPEGNAIVGLGEDGTYVAVKYGPDGSERWLTRHQVDDSKFADNAATLIAADRWGAVYLSGAGMDTVKLDSGGKVVWVREVDFQVNYHETTRAIAVNDVGNVYLTGYSSSDGHLLMKLIDPSQWRFIRGDADGDGRIDPVSDAVTILLAGLFGIGPIPCRAALDANGDGAAGEPVDAIVLLTWAFLGGPAPAAPFPECGPGHLDGDPALGCEEVAALCR